MRETKGRKTVIALDEDQSLFEVGSREVWQLPLISSDGDVVGVVVRQVIEARMYTVRYLIVFSPQRDRQFVIPANALADITADGVVCNLTSQQLESLPTFSQSLTKAEEEEIYSYVPQTPYWIEEQWVRNQGPPQKDN
ncbi:MAG: hypothetical protein GX030_10705 [Firmicutes bacterium]|nr:hypothetical protein [Bacillota bacterium]